MTTHHGPTATDTSSATDLSSATDTSSATDLGTAGNTTTHRRLAISAIIGGVILAAWITGGRFLFGVGGSLTPAYALGGLLVVVLYLCVGRAILRTIRNSRRTRPAVIGTLAASVGCGILLGLMIPDATPTGLQTILTGAAEPGLGIAIGISNPLAVVMLVLAIFSLVLANGDATGRWDAREDFDEYPYEYQRPQ